MRCLGHSELCLIARSGSPWMQVLYLSPKWLPESPATEGVLLGFGFVAQDIKMRILMVFCPSGAETKLTCDLGIG